MKNFARNCRALGIVLAGACATLMGAGAALADKIHLKDGRVLEGRVSREAETFVYFTVVIGGVESEQFFLKSQIEKIERDEAESTPAPAANRNQGAETGKASSNGSATRVAILNFGPPSSWQGAVDNTVGIQIGAAAWEEVIPILEEENIDVVVVRINSGGGYLLELEKFHRVFQEEYKPRFRTVAWIESAISAAAMSPWVIEEMYFLPEGNIGACTGWYGNLTAVKDVELEEVLVMMEEASRMAGRDPKIMRSMQIMDPLSASIDPVTGEVSWSQDESGDHVVNPSGRILTLNASDAMKFKFGKGIASTPEELCRVMGLQEFEIVDGRATKFIDENMRAADRTSKRLNELFQKYAYAVQLAAGLQDRKERGAQVGRARRFLEQMRQWVSVNPNFALLNGTTDEWFQEQEEILRDLMD